MHGKPYYRCSGRVKLTSNERCTAKTMNAKQLDDAVWAEIAEVLKNPKTILAGLEQLNNGHHQESFLEALPNLLKHFPDYNELKTVELIREKSQVLALGLDLRRFDEFRPKQSNEKPLLIWGHRWEHDKRPEEFFKALTILSERGMDFELAVLGENFSRKPDVFLEAEDTLAKHLVQFGYVESFVDYARWVWRATP